MLRRCLSQVSRQGRDKVDFWLTEAILDNPFGIWERIRIVSKPQLVQNHLQEFLIDLVAAEAAIGDVL